MIAHPTPNGTSRLLEKRPIIDMASPGLRGSFGRAQTQALARAVHNGGDFRH
jgi:hypothetical protein